MTCANAHIVRFPEGTALEVSARLIDIALCTRADAATAVVKHAQGAATAHVLTQLRESNYHLVVGPSTTPRRSLPATQFLTVIGIAPSLRRRLQKRSRCTEAKEKR